MSLLETFMRPSSYSPAFYNRENEILPLWETKRPKTGKQNRLGKHKSDKGKAPYRSYRSELNAIARRASHEAYG